jgi:hypothetical protein
MIAIRQTPPEDVDRLNGGSLLQHRANAGAMLEPQNDQLIHVKRLKSAIV